MRSVNILKVDTGQVSVPCQAGQHVRILSVFVIVNSPMSVLDVLTIQYLHSTQVMIEVVSGFTGGNTTNVSAFIGAATTDPGLQSIDPVTGSAAYGNSVRACMPLPNITWPHAVDLTIGNQGAIAIQSTTVVYETEDAPIPKTRK